MFHRPSLKSVSAARFAAAVFALAIFILSGPSSSAQNLLTGPSSQAFGQLAANTATPSSATLAYAFSGTTAPVFSLAYGTDFLVSSSACSGTSSEACTVTIRFAPQSVGARGDALVIKNAAGKLIGTTFLSGTGLGPAVSFAPGIINTLAGNGTWGYSGDNFLASRATLRNPQAVAVDNRGNIYLSDSVNQMVRQISASTGIITAIAGTGIPGYSGDGGLATRATLNAPAGIALDGAGNLYIADSGNNVIRKIDCSTQQISTVIGGGVPAPGMDGLGDGGPAANALLNGPNDVAVDGAGNLYIADSVNGLIRQVSVSTGIITVVAGGGSDAGTDGFGDDGLAVRARLGNPQGIGLDAAGNLYIADTSNQLVREVNASSGVISVIAGTGSAGFSGDGNLALKAQLNNPYDVAVDAAGDVYVADSNNNVLREISAASNRIATIAGTRARRYSGDSGLATLAGLSGPTSLALDGTGNLYIADLGNNAVRRVSAGPAAVTFPSTNVGQASPAQTRVLTNFGNQALQISAIAASTSFQQVPSGTVDCAASLSVAPGGVCVVAMDFIPTVAGSINGTMVITNNASNRSGSQQTFSLGGTRTTGAVPQVTLSTSSLSFGSQALGLSSASKTVTVLNTGAAPLAISAIQVAGVNAPEFGLTTTCQSVLAAGASCSLSVTFTPVSSGAKSLTVLLNDNVASSPSIAVTGTGVSMPQAKLDNAIVIFARRNIGSSKLTRQVKFTNSGSGPLNIKGVALSGADATLIDLTSTCGLTLSAGASCSFSLAFAPVRIGAHSAVLTINDDAPDSPQRIQITGYGNVKSIPEVWRSGTGQWISALSSSHFWGQSGDIPVPADYDGDGLVDFAVWRPSTGVWYVIPSVSKQPYSVGWGLNGDQPVKGDFDGDGKTDLAIFRPSSGVWYVLLSSTKQVFSFGWGLATDRPTPGDYDGDGRTDLAVFRPSDGSWHIVLSSTGLAVTRNWGLQGDQPVSGDFDGDGITDLAVFRPSTGIWYVIASSTGSAIATAWGVGTDVPLVGDFDGDGKDDLSVWRPSTSTWFVLGSAQQQMSTTTIGIRDDTPLMPSAPW